MEKIKTKQTSYGKIMGKIVCITGFCILFYTGMVLLFLSLNAQYRFFGSVPTYKVELIACILYFVGVAGIIAGIAHLAAKYIRKKERAIFDAVEHVGKQDLDFTISYCGVKEVDALLAAVEQMKDALKQSLEKQWRMEQNKRNQISALAHDLKTPVTVVKGNIYLLEQSGAENAMVISDMSAGIHQIEQYVSELLEVTRAENGYQLKKESIDLVELSQGVLENSRALFGKKEIEAFLVTREDKLITDVDPMLLTRALQNLISNAMDFLPEQGRIRLEIGRKDKEIFISVTDSGSGFSEQALRFGTEQFYMGDASRSRKNHYGIGLFVTSSIAKQHGGRIELFNDKEFGGAKVIIWLPDEKF